MIKQINKILDEYPGDMILINGERFSTLHPDMALSLSWNYNQFQLIGEEKMSADNGIYIAEFGDGFRVIHAQAIDNLTHFPPAEEAEEWKKYYGNAKAHPSYQDALEEAHQLLDYYTDDGIAPEYGIVFLGRGVDFDYSFKRIFRTEELPVGEEEDLEETNDFDDRDIIISELESGCESLREALSRKAEEVSNLQNQLRTSATSPMPFRIVLGMINNRDRGRWDRVVATFDDYNAAHMCYQYFTDGCDHTSEYDAVLFEVYTDRKEYFTMLIHSGGETSATMSKSGGYT